MFFAYPTACTMSTKLFWETLKILSEKNDNPQAYYTREMSNGYVKDHIEETIELQSVSLPIVRDNVSHVRYTLYVLIA